MKILEITANLVKSHNLCDNCLGRQFGNLLSGLSNDQRGLALKHLLIHQSMLIFLKEKLMLVDGFALETTAVDEGEKLSFCQKMEQELGIDQWTEFIHNFLLYVCMIAEIALRRDQSPKALGILEHLERYGYSPARETLKKSSVKIALEKIVGNRNASVARLVTNDGLLNCNYCLGILENSEFRSFLVSHVETKFNSSELIMATSEMPDNSRQCELCQDFFQPQSLEDWCDRIEEKCRDIEFYTFVVGSVIPPEIMEKEDEIHANYGLSEWAEILKSEINREVGKRLLKRWDSLQRSVDVRSQDLVILVNLVKNQVDLNIHPLFIEGRYCKYVRDIPQ